MQTILLKLANSAEVWCQTRFTLSAAERGNSCPELLGPLLVVLITTAKVKLWEPPVLGHLK